MDINKAQQLLQNFGKAYAVASETSSFGIYPDSVLPSPKDEIKDAIKSLILYCLINNDCKGVELYSASFVGLPAFIDKKLYKKIQFSVLLPDDKQERKDAISLFREIVARVADEAKLHYEEIEKYINDCKKIK